MPTKTTSLDLALPAQIIDLGQAIASIHAGSRFPARPNAAQPAAEQTDALVDRVLKLCRASQTARRLIGIRERGQDESERRVRLRVFALMAFRALVQPASQFVSEISDVAAAAMDTRLGPGEAVLRSRNIVGIMATEDILIAITGTEGGPCNKVVLSARALEWISGGKSSMGFLTGEKLSSMLFPKGFEDDLPPESAPLSSIPSAKELHARICERVVGLDEQVKVLSSLLVMHLARAKLLRDGKDPGTGNQAVLLVGSSGCGKTFLASEAARVSGCPFGSVSATSMTSEGFVGGKTDDLFRSLVMRTKGDMQAARFGIAFTDEWDKKASRQGRDVTTLAVVQEFLVPMGGAEFQIAGKRGNERPVTFDSRGTFFAFAGVFDGLAELIRKKTCKSCIGFSPGTRTRRQEYILDSICDYGYVREWANRLTSVMFVPDASLASLETAAAGGVLDSFNALLGELRIVLFPHQDATTRIAAYALESQTFYRGIKSVWWNLAESVVSSGERGLVPVGAADVDAAIGRIASGSAAGIVQESPLRQESICVEPSSADSSSESANG